MKKIYLLSLKFCKDKRGAIAVSFAFMLPALIGFFSIAVDGSRFNAERSRLNDALNQSVYAVAITNNGNNTAAFKAQNNDQVVSYLSYYFSDKQISAKDVTVTVNNKQVPGPGGTPIPAVDYQVNARVIANPIFDLSKNGSPGFNSNVTITGNGLSGIVRRTLVVNPSPGDYVFVVDFSGSMAEDSAQPGLTREKLLKKVVRDIGDEIFDLQDGSTIGIVPFGSGVPVILNKKNYASSQSKEYGCSFIGKMHSRFEKLDWNFWYNKPGGKGLPAEISKYVTKTDDALYDYYWYISDFQGYLLDRRRTNWLIDNNYCRQSGDKLLCDADPKSDIHNQLNQYKLKEQYSDFVAFTALEEDYHSILNSGTVDVAGTVSGDYLFDESNVRTISSFHNSYSLYKLPPDGDKNIFPATHYSCNWASPIKTKLETLTSISKPMYYLLELSTHKQIINEFEGMKPSGGTNSLSGLLRSVPLIAKGKNPRKIIFVISDGDDDFPKLRQDMMIKDNLCGVIKDGLKKYPANTPTTESDIYYISLVHNNTIKDWAANCVGQDNAYIATNIKELMDVIRQAIYKNEIEYLNPNDVK